MKKICWFLLLLLTNSAYSQEQKVIRCGTTQAVEQMKLNHPEYVQEKALVDKQVQQWITENQVSANGGNRAIITIPVVVHVLYRTASENISDAQVLSQIDVLNEDYARLNADAANTPAAFTGIAANSEIQFCLAKRDPSGVASNGIVRVPTTVNTFQANDAMKSSATGGSNPWPRNSYLNIWVCNLGSGLLGYAYPPGSPANIDGVVIGFRYFGRVGTLQSPYNKGRTATHEVGHWLNLDHIWGDDNGACNSSDQVADTPNQGDANYGCPSFPRVSCSNGPNGDMFMNYMDYTDDGCMNIFTAGQKARMLAVLNGTRASIKTSQGCVQGSGGGGTGGCDTLNNFLASDNFVVIRNTQGGYVSGHNSFNDKAKAERFPTALASNQVLKGAVLYFGVAKFSNATKKITLKVWNNAGTGGTPGAVLSQKDVLINSLSTTQANYIELNSPIAITTPYFIGFEMTYANGDTVALFNTADRPNGPNSAFEQFNDNSWFAYSAQGSWGIEVALGIEAVVCNSLDIENPPVLGDFSIFPNPTSNEFTLNLELFQKPAPADVKIWNMQGQLMKSERFNSAQTHQHQIHVGDLSAGIYMVEVQAGQYRQIKRIILQ